MTRHFSYDPKCEDLAMHFLPEDATELRISELAQAIQGAAEAWLELAQAAQGEAWLELARITAEVNLPTFPPEDETEQARRG